MEAMIAFEAGAVGVGVLLLVSGHTNSFSRTSGPILGAAAGLLLGVANVSIKALTGTVPGDLLSIVSPWTLLVLLAGAGAFFALARGLQTGGAIPVITLTAVSANLISIGGGILVFGDSVGDGALAIVNFFCKHSGDGAEICTRGRVRSPEVNSTGSFDFGQDD